MQDNNGLGKMGAKQAHTNFGKTVLTRYFLITS